MDIAVEGFIGVVIILVHLIFLSHLYVCSCDHSLNERRIGEEKTLWLVFKTNPKFQFLLFTHTPVATPLLEEDRAKKPNLLLLLILNYFYGHFVNNKK